MIVNFCELSFGSAQEWLPSSKYEFLYPCLSDKYLFMAAKNPKAGREQAIFLKRFKWQIKALSKAYNPPRMIKKYKIVSHRWWLKRSRCFQKMWVCLLNMWKWNRHWVGFSILKNLKRAMWKWKWNRHWVGFSILKNLKRAMISGCQSTRKEDCGETFLSKLIKKTVTTDGFNRGILHRSMYYQMACCCIQAAKLSF